jgi:hypothetical protein
MKFNKIIKEHKKKMKEKGKWNICDFCKQPYDKEKGYDKFCSKEHYKKSMKKKEIIL